MKNKLTSEIIHVWVIQGLKTAFKYLATAILYIYLLFY
jgi:hypothetical protein